jgi:hypothetical protein
VCYSESNITGKLSMTHFFKLNRNKIWYAYKFLSIPFVSFVCILLFISYYQNNLPSKQTILWIFFAFGVCIPIVALTAIVTPYFVKQLRWKTLFHTEDTLKNIGFTKTLINTDTKYFFTEEAFYKKEGNLEILVTLAKNSLDFQIYNQTKSDSFNIPLKKLKKHSAQNIVDEINKNNKRLI